MKSQKVKNKALELYISNVPSNKIIKQLNISKPTFYKWMDKYGWRELKEKSIKEAHQKLTNELINLQTNLGLLSSEQLLEKLKTGELKATELVQLAKLGLEVVRPKQVTNNLNITKNENQAIQVIIPKEVSELLEKEM